MLRKEKFKVACLIVGFTISFTGAFVIFSAHPRIEGHKTYEKGLFSDVAATGALAFYGPWMLGIGGLSLFGAYLLRDK